MSFSTNDIAGMFQSAMLQRMLPPDPNQILVEKSMEITAEAMKTEGKKAKLELYDAIQTKLDTMQETDALYEKYKALADD